MEKLYFSQSRFTRVAAIAIAAVSLSTSCVDNTYDLDKDIDLEVNVGGSLTVPVGSATVKLGDMISEDDLDKLEDDTYAFSVEDDLEITLDRLSKDNNFSFSFETPSEPTVVTTNFDVPTFDTPINLSLEQIEIGVATGLQKVNPGAGYSNSECLSMTPELNSLSLNGLPVDLNSPNIPIPAISIPLTGTSHAIDFSLNNNVTVPDAIEKITNIDLTGSSIKISIDAAALASCFKSGFKMVIPELSVTLPDGFKLRNSSSNVYTESNIEIYNSTYDIEILIDKYDKTIGKDAQGILEAIEGQILCEMGTPATIQGTTSGTIPADSSINIDVNTNIKVSDMSFEVNQIDIDVDGRNLSEAVNIDLDSTIDQITSVTLDPKSNKINVAISPISIPDAINVEGANINIAFPADKFDITPESGVITQASPSADYILTIPLKSLIRGVAFNKSISLNKIKLADCDIVEAGVDATAPNRHVVFDPEVTMNGTTLTVAMVDASEIVNGRYNISLSDYNEIVKDFDTSSSNNTITANVTANNLKISSAEIRIDGYSAPIDDQEFELATDKNDKVEIDDQIKEIYGMTFTEPVHVSVDIVVDADLGSAEPLDLSFDNYTILLPTFIEFGEDVVYTDYSEVVNGETKNYKAVKLQHLVNGKYEDDKFVYSDINKKYLYKKEIEITALNFRDYGDIISESNGDRFLDLDEKVTLRGGIKVGDSSINSEDVKGKVTCSANYYISNMSVATVAGVVDPNIECEPETIDLSDIAEDFGDDISIILSEPSITISAVNDLAIPLDITALKIQPLKEGSTIDPITLLSKVSIPAAQGDQAGTTTFTIWDATHGNSGEGVVLMENLNKLLNEMPEELVITYEAKVDDSVEHTIDLNKDYTFKLDYKINVPLKFDKFSLEYDATVENIGADLDEILDYVSALEVDLTLKNDLPVDITIFEITPLDEDGNVLNIDPIFEGVAEFKGSDTSTIELKIADNAAGDLRRLDGLKIALKADADTTNGAAGLNANQTVTLSIAARVPDGINLDLNE